MVYERFIAMDFTSNLHESVEMDPIDSSHSGSQMRCTKEVDGHLTLGRCSNSCITDRECPSLFDFTPTRESRETAAGVMGGRSGSVSITEDSPL